MPYKDKERKRQWYVTRRVDRRAKGLCVVCGISKSKTTRCNECKQKRKELYDKTKSATWGLPASELSTEELYRRAKAEREVISWSWSHPA